MVAEIVRGLGRATLRKIVDIFTTWLMRYNGQRSFGRRPN